MKTKTKKSITRINKNRRILMLTSNSLKNLQKNSQRAENVCTQCQKIKTTPLIRTLISVLITFLQEIVCNFVSGFEIAYVHFLIKLFNVLYNSLRKFSLNNFLKTSFCVYILFYGLLINLSLSQTDTRILIHKFKLPACETTS